MIQALENLSSGQVLALMILVGVLAWAFAHYHAGQKVATLVAAEKAKFQAVEKRAEDYTDAEIAKLVPSFVARLADTSQQLSDKADADAAIARKVALLARIQPAVAAVAVKTA